MQVNIDLLQKYNVPVPRYTSYPTVPFWKETIDRNEWENVIKQQFTINNTKDGISLYLHLPFCESLCTYCGCNKKITANHSVEEEYMGALVQEWHLYLSLMEEKPVIRELHLGGGTPTFFSPANLTRLLNAIFAEAAIHPEHEFSFEGHPNNTTKEHLQTLYNLGFRRVSYGVQDLNKEVQIVINRIQPFENVERAVKDARDVGYTSVNIDLIYGLPLQTKNRIKHTILKTIELKPDRVAFYSYAHVPWTSRGQRLFDENDLPAPEEKMRLYQLGKKLFTENGYKDIGMDHFALPNDELFKAREEGKLHRNFMGYTTQQTNMLIGLGVSSISDAGIAFAQNYKTIHEYYAAVSNGELPVTKGYFLTGEDLGFKKYILNISCNGYTLFKPEHMQLLQEFTFPELVKLEADGLVIWNEESVKVTALGMHFIRNICKAFDLQLLRREMVSAKLLFSKAI